MSLVRPQRPGVLVAREPSALQCPSDLNARFFFLLYPSAWIISAVWAFALCMYVLWGVEGLELRCLRRKLEQRLLPLFNAKLSFNINVFRNLT
jgi:hypothetical protein